MTITIIILIHDHSDPKTSACELLSVSQLMFLFRGTPAIALYPLPLSLSLSFTINKWNGLKRDSLSGPGRWNYPKLIYNSVSVPPSTPKKSHENKISKNKKTKKVTRPQAYNTTCACIRRRRIGAVLAVKSLMRTGSRVWSRRAEGEFRLWNPREIKYRPYTTSLYLDIIRIHTLISLNARTAHLHN